MRLQAVASLTALGANAENAVPALKEAIRLNPTDPGPYNTLGQVLRLSGDPEGSRQAFAEGARAKAAKDKQSAEMLRKK